MNVLLWTNTNDFPILEVMMNQIYESREQHMKFDLIYSVCATNHIIVSHVMGSSGLVKLKQPPPAVFLLHIHTHTHSHLSIYTDRYWYPSPCQVCLVFLEQSSPNDCSPSHSLLRTGPSPSVRLLLFLMQAIRTQPRRHTRMHAHVSLWFRSINQY